MRNEYLQIIEDALNTVEREYRIIGRSMPIQVCQRIREEVLRRLLMKSKVTK